MTGSGGGGQAHDPRPAYPIGWFRVVAADDLPVGTIHERSWLGEQVVAFRSTDGRANVLAAHCPHMGANLARGGTIVGDSIRCPFHSLRWDGSGRCVGSDYPGDPDYPVTARSYPTVERFGFVFAWHDPGGRAPTFDLPDLDLAKWTVPLVTTIPIAAHVETIFENGVDTAHFAHVHGFTLSDPAFAEDGATFHAEFNFAVPNFLGEGPAEVVTFFDTDNHGLGCSISENTARDVGLHYLVILLPVPTGPSVTEFAIVTTVERPPTGEHIGRMTVDDIAEVMHRGAVGGVHQDIPIWEGLRYVPKPRLVKGDGPFPRLRHWARQFDPA